MPTLPVVLVHGENLIYDFKGSITKTLTLSDLFNVASPLSDKVIDFQHRVGAVVE